ncbi:MAG: integration host factor subunit beta [Proteobacteria bacterium]|nr:integration host factor subunit beta [Pseudomonadota bacterium]
MRKKEFLKVLAERFPDLPEELIVRMSNKIIEQIISTLKDGGRVEIRGFGAFFYSTRKPRLLTNPRTNAVIEIPEKRIPRFKAGKSLSKRVNDES